MTHTTEPNWDFKDNFITVIDNALTEDFCDKCIWYFEKAQEYGMTYSRRKAESAPAYMKSDIATNVDLSVPSSWLLYKDFNKVMSEHFESYFAKYETEDVMILEALKIQKTEPSEGYHIWHSDGGGQPTMPPYKRSVTFVYYLNDVEEGGETEFLYQKERVKPVKGRGVWFPSCYTHTHRGNPPISNTKYILTGWLQYSE